MEIDGPIMQVNIKDNEVSIRLTDGREYIFSTNQGFSTIITMDALNKYGPRRSAKLDVKE